MLEGVVVVVAEVQEKMTELELSTLKARLVTDRDYYDKYYLDKR
jgi:hypothetical protein